MKRYVEGTLMRQSEYGGGVTLQEPSAAEDRPANLALNLAAVRDS